MSTRQNQSIATCLHANNLQIEWSVTSGIGCDNIMLLPRAGQQKSMSSAFGTASDWNFRSCLSGNPFL
jgi:hypothetical protein